jgi:hypothetical protein
MHRIAMEHIFAHISVADARILEEGIEGWSKKADLNPSERWEITRIINALIANENGHFNRAKSILAQNKWHYRKLYKVGLPFIAAPDKCRTFGKM